MTTKATDKEVVQSAMQTDVLDFGALLGSNVERKLKFKPRPEFNNLCKGRLVSAEIQMVKTESLDKSGLPSAWEYAGLDLPTLRYTFIQEPTQADPAERIQEHYFSPFTNVKKNGEAMERSSILNHYTEEYKLLRHFANAYVTNANYDAKLVVPAVNPFITDPIARLENIKAYYQYWATLMSGKDGKGFATQPVWLKLVASPEGTYLKFPSFVNEGFIEKVVDGRQPSIELKPSETIELVKKEPKATSKAGAKASNEDAPVSDEVQALLAKYTTGS
jgi:hypothetical protein